MPVVNAVPVNVAGTTIQARLHLVAGVLRNVLLTTLWTARRASVLLLCLLVQLGTTGVAKNVPRIVLTAVQSTSVQVLVQAGIKASAVDAAPKNSMDALKRHAHSQTPIGSTTNAVSAPQHRLKAAAPTDARLT